ncbi:MAG: signaling protein, partial [Verrucomicrobia bacterium]
MIKPFFCWALLFAAAPAWAVEFWISPQGNDANPGTRERPFASLARARDAVRSAPQRGREPVTVTLREGVYRLPETLVFTPADSGSSNAPVVWRAAAGQTVVISGGVELHGLRWRPYR